MIQCISCGSLEFKVAVKVILIFSLFQTKDLANKTMTSIARELFEGAIFNTSEEALESVVAYNEANFVDFRSETHKKKSYRFVCKHGCRQNARGKGERPLQHYNVLGCEAAINFYISQKDETLKCTKLKKNHNHVVSEQLYNHEHTKLNQDEVELCATLRDGNCKPSQIKRVILEKFNKDVKISKFRNILRKVPSGKDNDVDYEEFFERFEHEGGDLTELNGLSGL